MTLRSAPFNTKHLNNDSGRVVKPVIFSNLVSDIKQFRADRLPPPYLEQVRDLPIFYGNTESVDAYRNEWKPLIDHAKSFYPTAYLPPDNLPFPASLEIPQFIYQVERVSLNKTNAKESKSFGSVSALIEKCGLFSETDMNRLEAAAFAATDDFKLVAHRTFTDLRAYVFCLDVNGELLPPKRIRFYKTGLIMQTNPDFTISDQRQTPRKKRNDAYLDPIADNDVWKVFLKSK